MSGGQDPNWFEWAKLLMPAFIALIALIITAWIQIGQKTISKNKLKLELFKERYELLNVVNNIVKSANRPTNEFLDEMILVYEKFRQDGLLFPKGIADKVDQLWDMCYQHQGLSVDRKDAEDTPDWGEINQKYRESQRRIENFSKELRVEISEFIRVDWQG